MNLKNRLPIDWTIGHPSVKKRIPSENAQTYKWEGREGG